MVDFSREELEAVNNNFLPNAKYIKDPNSSDTTPPLLELRIRVD